MKPSLPDYTRSRAILIGVSSYQDKGFLALPAAANSLKGLQEILVDQQLCGWPPSRVTAVLNPVDSRRLVANLRRWAREIEDVLLVYYVSHGTITPDGQLCLALSDTEFDDPDITGVEYRHIRSALLDSPARIKVVILDCCYSGRAIQAMSHPEEIADITDIRGAYTITASDNAAHVPALPEQTRACTSFTGELLDLIRTGISGGPEMLTLNMMYGHLRTRLRKCHLPAPNQRGTDTAGEFVFTRNAALLPHPIERFPREQPSMIRRFRERPILVAAVAMAVAATVVLVPRALGSHNVASPCGSYTATAAPGNAAGPGVVVGSGNFTESILLGQIYTDALEAKGIAVTTDFCISSREVYYPEVEDGQIDIVPEYNGALLTTEVNTGSTVYQTMQVDKALTAALPPSLMILTPSRAQDQDTMTVTKTTATKYDLKSIADLSRVANKLVIGGPSEFQGRMQGILGLTKDYGLTFKEFVSLDDDSGQMTIDDLISGRVEVADIFTTAPWFTQDSLVILKDPRHLFTAENVVPLVYKRGVNTTVIKTLNDVSAKLTTNSLSNMDIEVMLKGVSVTRAAQDWINEVGLGSA